MPLQSVETLEITRPAKQRHVPHLNLQKNRHESLKLRVHEDCILLESRGTSMCGSVVGHWCSGPVLYLHCTQQL